MPGVGVRNPTGPGSTALRHGRRSDPALNQACARKPAFRGQILSSGAISLPGQPRREHQAKGAKMPATAFRRAGFRPRGEVNLITSWHALQGYNVSDQDVLPVPGSSRWRLVLREPRQD